MFDRFLFVFDLLLNLFRIALWPSVEKELSPWLFTGAVFYFSAVLTVSVPDHYLFIYFQRHTLPVHGKDPVSRQILAHQRNWNQSITCAAPRTTPISLGTSVSKADGGPKYSRWKLNETK